MSTQKTITINGQHYDAHTGLPVEQTPTTHVASIAPSQPVLSVNTTPSAASVHTTTQKSQTLNRKAAKRPAGHTPHTAASAVRPQRRSMDIARSSTVAHFAPHPVTKPAHSAPQSGDIMPVKHPAVVKAHAAHAAKHAPTPVTAPKPAQVIKNEAIAEALAKPTPKQSKKKIFKKHHPRLVSIFSVSLALLILGGYLTYLNMPSLSVRVAAAQAGIAATYPQYRPDGYSLNGPVAYTDGQVSMKFAANSGTSTFTVKQAKSSWDSSAVRNKVDTDSNGAFITTQERGYTIYTYNGNAAWVNGGILYTIEGDAPLSSDQIRRIATSL